MLRWQPIASGVTSVFAPNNAQTHAKGGRDIETKPVGQMGALPSPPKMSPICHERVRPQKAMILILSFTGEAFSTGCFYLRML